MNNLVIIVLAIVIFVFFMCSRQENLYGSVTGSSQRWMPKPRERLVCDTDYNDDECQFVALNCAGNPGSLLRDA